METKSNMPDIEDDFPVARRSRTVFSTISDHINKEDAQSWLHTYLKSTEPSEGDLFRSRYLNKLGIDEKSPKKDLDSTASSEHSRAKTMFPKMLSTAQNRNSSYLDLYHLHILTRSDDEVRKNYLAKLKNNKILLESPSKKHQTSIRKKFILTVFRAFVCVTWIDGKKQSFFTIGTTLFYAPLLSQITGQ